MPTGKVSKITRKFPRSGINESPDYKPGHGYVLGHPKHGGAKHHKAHAVYVKTLEEAAFLIESGLSLRMIGPGKRASLICPDSLQIEYEK
jgi:hypothetical protein